MDQLAFVESCSKDQSQATHKRRQQLSLIALWGKHLKADGITKCSLRLTIRFHPSKLPKVGPAEILSHTARTIDFIKNRFRVEGCTLQGKLF